MLNSKPKQNRPRTFSPTTTNKEMQNTPPLVLKHLKAKFYAIVEYEQNLTYILYAKLTPGFMSNCVSISSQIRPDFFFYCKLCRA